MNEFHSGELKDFPSFTGIYENNDLGPFLGSFSKLFPKVSTLAGDQG